MKNMYPFEMVTNTYLEFGELLSCEGGEENKQRKSNSESKGSRTKRNKSNLHDDENSINLKST